MTQEHPPRPMPEKRATTRAPQANSASSERLLTFSRPVIEGLYRQISRPHATVLLAAQDGTILSTVGDSGLFAPTATVILRSADCSPERCADCESCDMAVSNGIMVVDGDDRYIEHNHHITCLATPIHGPSGGLLGLLDTTSHARAGLTHARVLLRTTAALIEQRLLESAGDGFMTVHFDTHASGLETPLHAVAVFDHERLLVASTRCARGLLKLGRDTPATHYENHFRTPWDELISHCMHTPDELLMLGSVNGQEYVARATLRSQHHPRYTALATPARGASSALQATALGDPRFARIVTTLRDSSASNAPLLFTGEMGTGKAYLIRAFHADQRATPDAPLIGVDCSALAEGEEGAHALEHARAQAANGILVLVEIETLPLALQEHMFGAVSAAPTRIIGTVRQPLAHLLTAGCLSLASFDDHGGQVLSLPPVRERADFAALVRHLVREAAPGRHIAVSADALELLRHHRWPGNVRELRNELQLILALIGDDATELGAQDIRPDLLDDGGQVQG
ncbi:MAG: sigma 54-interacting transcriptional regulator [Rhodocyclales bacterium]|nr:sigma 54-interacting transcriptional regulator [Rhodocyclales bacterium]